MLNTQRSDRGCNIRDHRRYAIGDGAGSEHSRRSYYGTFDGGMHSGSCLEWWNMCLGSRSGTSVLSPDCTSPSRRSVEAGKRAGKVFKSKIVLAQWAEIWIHQLRSMININLLHVAICSTILRVWIKGEEGPSSSEISRGHSRYYPSELLFLICSSAVHPKF